MGIEVYIFTLENIKIYVHLLTLHTTYPLLCLEEYITDISYN